MKKTLYGTFHVNDLPPKNRYEIALIGRSNVGKSSLINALLQKKVAKVSRTPGSTLWLSMYPLHNVNLVDLPGYGYAKTGESRKAVVSEMLEDYFNLRRTDMVMLLVDLRRGFMTQDMEINEFLNSICPNIQFIGTKADKKDSQIFSVNFRVSTLTGEGVKELSNYIKSIDVRRV